MQIRIINCLSDFDQLREPWARVHAIDPHASVFVSWPWLRGWFAVTPSRWCVLAARPDDQSPWAGFLPLSLHGRSSLYRLDQIRELRMGGEPAADYTGFVCDPEQEQAVIAALARYMSKELRWDRLRWKEIDDPRIDLFVDQLSRFGNRVENRAGTCCPFIALPDTWDEYLQQCLTYETRKSLRKKLRIVERECTITHLNGENRDQQIDTLLMLAGQRPHHWSNELWLNRFRSVFQWCAGAGFASILIIWMGDTAIAGMGSFIDCKTQSLAFYQTGFDDRFSEYSPGRVVNALGIQYAIERGMKKLDFLRGAEPYKLQFGAQLRHTRTFVVARQNLRATARLTVDRMRSTLGI